ncbi:MAG: PQQ-binding-like beta-propeller repeat protein [Rhodobiaceae bacterium]|nr:PQQ-binding-like beta-propeller repeat protein [Rhodobiaceae bacterium]MCC0049844.1 PQQ-binding-like beta-propeller repeat protein [Rhodobiaceae bacterium]
MVSRVSFFRRAVFPAMAVALAAASLAACSPPREMPTLGTLMDPFRGPEAKVPGERRDALPATGGNNTVTGEAVSLASAQLLPEWPNPGGPATNAPGHLSTGSGAYAYAVPIGKGSARRSRLVAPPVVHQGYAFAMDAQGNVAAVNLSNGSRMWSVSTKPENERGRATSGAGLAASGGRVFVATAYGVLKALDISSGAQIWEAKLSAPARSAPTVADGKIYVVSATNVVHAINTADGTEAWQFNGIPETAGIMAPSSPAVSGDRVIVPYSSGEIIGFGANDGQPLWSDQLTGQSRFSSVSGIRDVAARPVVVGNTVYAVGVGGRLAAVSVKDGERLWGANVASSSTPAVSGNSIFVSTLDNQLIAIDRDDGSFRWAVKLPKDVTWVGPLLAGNALWLGSSDGRILRASPVDGSTISETKIGKAVLIPPIGAAGRVLVLDDSGRLNVFN